MKSKIPLQNLSHHYEEECSDDDTDLKKIYKSVRTRRIKYNITIKFKK